eukprot:CAMPEP_0172700940 /NCGR_PEP_ID=MMETSP1074-20121228/31268_1 /TAXON_ID=2916 /ORGANISM="Ceratium fusus, Strain PA161109" /LENGTH=301 /DNA_ID=CAMNT_0013522407 /DNA_START=314 /DNA_END=1216 /DNA_ORIENTATION=+
MEPSGKVDIALLDGRRCTLEIQSETTLAWIKEQISKRLGVVVAQQRLMHGGEELKGDDLRWKNAKVQYGSVLQLLVVMYETEVQGRVPNGGGNVRELTFDLSWTGRLKTTSRGKTIINHLNGSCIVFDASGNFLNAVDFQHLNWRSIQHHGPSSKISPRQKITVSMDRLGSGVTYLFFTLSAGWSHHGPFLRDFENPMVQLRDAVTNRTLATYTAAQATHGQSVVLCCAKRDAVSGAWRVQRIGSLSEGSVKFPEQLIASTKRIDAVMTSSDSRGQASPRCACIEKYAAATLEIQTDVSMR